MGSQIVGLLLFAFYLLVRNLPVRRGLVPTTVRTECRFFLDVRVPVLPAVQCGKGDRDTFPFEASLLAQNHSENRGVLGWIRSIRLNPG